MSPPNKKARHELYLAPLDGIVRAPTIPPPNRPGRRTNILDELKIVVKALLRHPSSYHFRNPLGSNPKDLPNFQKYMKRPMDLDTILKRLNNNYYWQGSEAVEDINLIFENCELFRRGDFSIYHEGVILKGVFNTFMASIDMTKEQEVYPNGWRPKKRSASCP